MIVLECLDWRQQKRTCQLVTATCLLHKVSSNKVELGDIVDILGITFDFRSGPLGIEEERRVKLLAEIQDFDDRNLVP